MLIRNLSTLLALALTAPAALADSGVFKPAPPSGGAIGQPSGAYTALAFGVRRDAHGGVTGFYTRGRGKTQKIADNRALDRCETIAQTGCRLVD